MKILLINNVKLSREVFPPYGLGLLNKYLKKQGAEPYLFDLDVVIKYLNSKYNNHSLFDLSYLKDNYKKLPLLLKREAEDEYYEKQVERLLKTFNPNKYDVLAFHVPHNEVLLTLYMAKKIYEKYGCKIVLGGTHIRRMHRSRIQELINIYNINYVDFFIWGNAFNFFNKFLKGKVKKQTTLAEIKTETTGLGLYEEWQTPEFNKRHLDLYKMDVKKLEYFFPQLSKNIINKMKELKNTKRELILPYRFQYGCNNSCAFCGLSGEKFALPVKGVSDQLDELKERYKCRNFYFLNNNFMMEPKYAEGLLNNLREKNVRWCDCSSIRGTSPGIIHKMSRSGCIQLLFGLETGSQRLLNFINKNSGINNLRNYSKTFRECHQNDIWINVDLISGLPFERNIDIKKTITYLKNKKKYIDGIFVNPFILMQNSDFARRPARYNLKLHNNQGRISSWEVNNYRSLYFHEINGLSWHRKQEQIQYSTTELLKFINKHFPLQFYQHYPLFYLYNYFDTKRDIKEFLIS